MRKFSRFLVATGIAVAFTQLLAVSAAYAKMVDCDKGQSLQAAVNTAATGTLIQVTGTCTEKVNVDTDDVEIVGIDGATVIGPPGSFGTFTVRARRVVILDFTVFGEAGFVVREGASAEIRGNSIQEVTNVGISIGAGSYGNIRSNYVTGDGSFSGIHIFQGSSADIGGNTVINPTGCGICIEGASSAVVSDNTVLDSISGIGALESSYIFLPGGAPNTLDGNDFGVACEADAVYRVDVAQVLIANAQDGLQFNGCTIRNFSGAPFPLP